MIPKKEERLGAVKLPVGEFYANTRHHGRGGAEGVMRRR